MITICFVCTGNTCRSIMAERLMKKHIKQNNIADVKVISRGINANGENITENAKKVLKKYKALASNRKSVKLGKIDKNILYVVMNNNMKKFVNSNKLLSFEDLTGYPISDPYGLNEEVYENTLLQLDKGVKIILNQIELGRKI